MSGKLFVCPTPIGNLEDITYRTLRVLNEVDIIAAEDTRHSIKLLNHFEISKPLTSYHEHNKYDKADEIVEKIKAGKNVAIITDAGMPGISDPGEELICKCIQEDIEIEVLPGASAFVVALVGSGLSTRRFYFEGFLDRDKKKKRERLKELKNIGVTTIIYESPHRLKESLKIMLEELGNRKISICRELTKKYEEYLRFSIEDAIFHYTENQPKGEYIIIIEGVCDEDSSQEDYSHLSDREYVMELMKVGITKKDAIKKVSKERGLKKDIVYKQVMDL